MKKRYLKCLIVVLLISNLQGIVLADQQNFDVSKVAAASLGVGMGARPVAMAEAYTAIADDYHATLYNPAGLVNAKNNRVGLMHNVYLQESSIEYMGSSYKLSQNQAVGLSISYMNYGEIDKLGIDNNGLPEELGSFIPYDLILTGSYAQKIIADFSLGLSLKYFQQKIDTKAYNAFAADFGLLFKSGIEGLTTGLALKNIGSQIAGLDLPIKVVLGVAYVLPLTITEKDNWVLDVDVDLPFGDTNYIATKVGTEYWYNNLLAIRAGYQISDKGSLNSLSGISFGAGFKYSILQIDYAMTSFGELGLSHQMALSLSY